MKKVERKIRGGERSGREARRRIKDDLGLRDGFWKASEGEVKAMKEKGKTGKKRFNTLSSGGVLANDLLQGVLVLHGQ